MARDDFGWRHWNKLTEHKCWWVLTHSPKDTLTPTPISFNKSPPLSLSLPFFNLVFYLQKRIIILKKKKKFGIPKALTGPWPYMIWSPVSNPSLNKSYFQNSMGSVLTWVTSHLYPTPTPTRCPLETKG